MRYCYLHGFASGPNSSKARYFSDALAAEGIQLEIPALDLGDFEHLTITGQLDFLEKTLDGDPACLIGSSMGGYLAALHASNHPEVAKLVLLASAFGLAELLEKTIPAGELDAWQRTGWRDTFHYASGRTRQIHFHLIEDARRYPAVPDFPQPSLLFHGTCDDVVPIRQSRSFAEAHPNVELIELESGHELVDALDRIAARAVPFLLSARI